MAASSEGYRFDFSGGALCLDFVNTLGDRPRAAEEHLQGWRDLVSWGLQAGVISGRDASRLRAACEDRPVAADRAFARALALREHLYRIFSSLAAGRSPGSEDFAALNAALAEAMAHSRIDVRDGGFVWAWAGNGSHLARILWPVLQSSANLLTSSEVPDVRECASDVCSWLFVDRSRTHRRRWCSMKTCGNRDKVRRFYERQQAKSR